MRWGFIGSHKTHDCSDIEEVSDSLRKVVTGDVDKANDCLKKTKELIPHLEKRQKEFIKHLADTADEINRTADKLISRPTIDHVTDRNCCQKLSRSRESESNNWRRQNKKWSNIWRRWRVSRHTVRRCWAVERLVTWRDQRTVYTTELMNWWRVTSSARLTALCLHSMSLLPQPRYWRDIMTEILLERYWRRSVQLNLLASKRGNNRYNVYLVHTLFFK